MLKKTFISMVAAIDERGAIGNKNRLLCHLPEDLKRFKHLTMGHSVIMGRKTFDSLPQGALPGRRNIVLTRNTKLSIEQTEIAHSAKQVLDMCSEEDEIFIIGGGEIYRTFWGLCDRLYITRIKHRFQDVDTYFPEITPGEWYLRREQYVVSDPWDCLFLSYEREYSKMTFPGDNR